MAEENSLKLCEKKWKIHLNVLYKNARLLFKKDEIGLEIFHIALPAAMALAADPIASLIDTAFIGHIGPVELAAVGVSIAIFNQVSRVTIFPVSSVTTSFVAEEDTISRITEKQESDNLEKAVSVNKEMEESTEKQESGNLEKAASVNMEMKELPEKQESDNLEHAISVSKEMEESTEKQESGNLEKAASVNMEMKELPEKQESDNLEHAVSVNMEMKELPEKQESDNLEKALSVNKEMKELTSNIESGLAVQQLPSKTEGNLKKAKLEHDKRHISSALSALIIGGALGILQAIFLILAAKPLLNFMGVKSDSPMLKPARQYLILRALGSPAILLSLAMQGIFRGFKDTKTPLYAIVAGAVVNIILDPVLMFVFELGVSGAAIAHIASQYLISILLLWKLMQRIYLLPKSFNDLRFARFLKSGSLLLFRVISTTFCVTLAASMATRLGSTTMAAFQVCVQVWMTTSLLNDGLAIAGQAMLACAFAGKDHAKALATAARVLQLALVMGVVIACTIGVGLEFGSGVFTKDIHVLHIISIGIPFVAGMQPINALAFVLDGVNYGASDFAYAAISTILVAVVTIPCLFVLSHSNGFVGIWTALTIYMSLRAFAGFGRIGTGSGPWRFL